MARYYLVQVSWRERVPTRRELERLQRILDGLDWDMPRFTSTGLYDRWRSPLLSLRGLRAVVHAFGYPTYGRWTRCDDYYDADLDELHLEQTPWARSEPDLGSLAQYQRDSVSACSRRFGRYLPARTPSKPGPHGRRSRGARRRRHYRLYD